VYAIAALASLIEGTSWARPVDLSAPGGVLGPIDNYGHVRFFSELGEVDFGDGLTLPLRFEFGSHYTRSSPYLGLGFRLPLLESHHVLIREKMMRCYLLCGKHLYLRQDRKDKNKFATLNGEWTGKLDGDTFVISRDDGWELGFRKGKVEYLKTDKGREIRWKYSGNVAVEMYEPGGASVPLRVETDASGNVEGLLVNQQNHEIALDQRPIVRQVKETHLVEGFVPALAAWKLPSGKQESFAFEVEPKTVTPQLHHTSLDGEKTTITWEPKQGYVRSVDGWSYTVTEKPAPGSRPNYEPPDLRRTTAEGLEEFIKLQNRKGIAERKSLDKGHIITHTHKSPGPLFGKLRRKVQILDDGTEKLLYQAGYDEAGRLIRETDAQGFITHLQRDPKTGKVIDKAISDMRDPVVLKSLAQKEQELLTQIEQAESYDQRDAALQALGLYYICLLYTSPSPRD